MDISPLLSGLNDAQRAAVAAPLAPTLVLAGAGSGKTRVLTHRVAWLVQVEQVSAHSILAVTFTNKAAGEMRSRIESMLHVPSAPLWIGTFHGIAHRLLRLHWRETNLPQAFQIMDADDQLRAIRKLLKARNMDEARWAPKEVMWFINARKDEGQRAGQLKDEGDPTRREFIRLYAAYQEQCDRSGIVDFAELLLRVYELLRNNPDMRAHYRRRFRHVLIDEFQDTNTIQYAWLKLLTSPDPETSPGGLPFAVGDDDQSIYRWRGARVENLHQFQRDYPGVQLFRLEQNYRSTGNILSAANALIANNSGRLGKNLWTSGEQGEPVRLYTAFNERDEADFVINQLRDWIDKGGRRDECAILYRSNAQSRTFEEALLSARIPYRVYGGLRFFERAEIKDALAYLRLIFHRADDASFERIVNLPTRGIGLKTLDTVRDYARANTCSMWEAAGACIAELGARAGSCLHAFLALIDLLDQQIRALPLFEQVDHVIHASGLLAHYRQERGDRGEARVENLNELVTAARNYEPDTEDAMPPLASFLAHAVLESGEQQADAWEDSVQMMSLHSAKGLEFPLVFLTGLEDGLFPHLRSLSDAEGLEEERRLCYVGTTRAMRQLYLTYAEQRRLHGQDNYAAPSRFIREIPPEFIEEVRPRIQISRPVYMPRGKAPAALREDTSAMGIQLGQRVRHGKFGEGVVVDIEGQGNHARVQVNFEQHGSAKWLMLTYANLEPV
ncbi:DNA-dependent helicase II [Steroidobacter denitrificans]|uniref:DNA 3'-5' helicase n=1 Tax=Steroidobacter denitrificans TaxID=465721 RepID=A0A127FDL5_STEDE|nr:DNA helicase II [Steroidobacter denitrificans]AMN48452.1 DNA-dependent helicase II [Steroidobacter denitrificans]